MLLVLFGAIVWAEDQNASGSLIDDALLIDVSPDGLQAIGEGLPGLIPSPIELPTFAEESSACPTGGYWYKFEFKRAKADIQFLPAQTTGISDGR